MRRGACVVLLSLVAFAPEAHGQRRGRRRTSPDSKNHTSFRASFRSSIAVIRDSTVRIMRGDAQVALGAIVDKRGHVLTKASEIAGGGLTCILLNGAKHTAKLLASDVKSDLALLKIEATGLTPITFAAGVPEVGSWVVTASTAQIPLAVGVVSMAPRTPRGRIRRRGGLEIGFADTRMSARVVRVPEGGPAAKIGLRPGDVIERLGDRWAIHSPASFARNIARFRPGQRIKIQVRRDGELEELEGLVGASRDRTMGAPPRQVGLWGPLSRVRAGFGEVMSHDSVLRPEQCGGPLVDLDGHVVGINVARAGRVETWCLTGPRAKAIVQLLERKVAKRRRL